MEWPFESKFRCATWAGRFPDGAIGIIHTHPNAFPDPSPEDREVARRVKMPVFVVTRTMIAWTDGDRTESIWLGAWSGPQDAAAVAGIERRAASRAAR